MTVDAAALRARRNRIEQRSVERSPQPNPNTFRTGSGLFPVVIRSTKEEVLVGHLKVQRIRYKAQPPVAGEFEGIGQWRDAVPYWGSKVRHYAEFAWGPDDPLTSAAYVYLAMWDRAAWVLVMPLKIMGSVLDPDDPTSGCSFG